MTATTTEGLTDPTGAVVGVVLVADTALTRAEVEAAIATVAPRRVARRRLAQALLTRPSVLSDGRSPAPRVVGELLVELCKRGAAAISGPRCVMCDKEMRSFHRRGDHWYCSVCGPPRVACAACGAVRRVGSIDRHGRPRCSSCPPEGEDPIASITRVVRRIDPSLRPETVAAAVTAVTSRAGERRRLAWALEDRPDLLTGTAAEAPVPSVLRLIDKLREAGATEIVAPTCPHCGRAVALSKFQGVRICRRCEARLRSVPCGRCGAVRDPVTRDDKGRPICANCFIRDPLNQEDCTGCGRRRPVSVRTGSGPLCDSCRPKKEMTCAICGRLSVCEIAKATSKPWCRACQHRWATCAGCGQRRPVRGGSLEAPLCAMCTRSDPSFWRSCPDCGEATKLTSGPCARCALRRRLVELLGGGGGGAIRRELQPFFDSLVDERPGTVAGWLRRSEVSEVLAGLGSGLHPVSHESLDLLPGSKAVEHLRSVLVATAVLEARDEQMVRLERWVNDVIAARNDPEDAKLLRRYGIWHLLRRLRRRLRGADATYGQTVAVKRCMRGAITLIDWLAVRGLRLDSADQGDLDAFSASHSAARSVDVGHFVRWAASQGITRLELPAVRWSGPSGVIDADRRWEQARRLLRDETIDPSDRVAGLLVLLYAQRASTISRLCAEQVADGDDGVVRLRLGDRPVVVPEPLAALLLRLVASREGHAVLGDTGTAPWLFPGGQPGRPISASRLAERLRDLGIHAGPARTATLFQLATELPAAVIARLLGIHIKVAVQWQRASSGDWVAYAADYSRRSALR